MERRRFQRFNVNGRIRGEIISSSDVELQDISPGGVRFLTTRRMNPNSNCTFTLNFNGKKISVNATVVRSMLKGTKKVNNDYLPIYEVALEFNNIDEIRDDIETIIQELLSEKITIK
ncbi:MAG: PilZ domain-containing protein [Nitrospirae bacterium]|nr:PilZ domain-containing protein [Nitrospirota bacterium]